VSYKNVSTTFFRFVTN